MSPSQYLSKQAYKKLEEELEYLTKRKRREISRRLGESSSFGDLSENAEYQDAKDTQLMNEQRIAELEELFSCAVVFTQTNKARMRIELGCFVVLKKENVKKEYKYQIVVSGEADPVERKISHESPLGQSLLRRKKGETVKVLTPNGEISYTIIEII